MKNWIALLLATVMCLSLAACGKNEAPATNTPAQNATSTPTTAPEAEQTEPTEPQQEAVGLSIGDKIDNENFTMTFDSMEILDEYSYKTSEYSSTSLYVESGYKLLLVMGNIELYYLSLILFLLPLKHYHIILVLFPLVRILLLIRNKYPHHITHHHLNTYLIIPHLFLQQLPLSFAYILQSYQSTHQVYLLIRL